MQTVEVLLIISSLSVTDEEVGRFDVGGVVVEIL